MPGGGKGQEWMMGGREYIVRICSVLVTRPLGAEGRDARGTLEGQNLIETGNHLSGVCSCLTPKLLTTTEMVADLVYSRYSTFCFFQR
jgi:hypothetical protein